MDGYKVTSPIRHNGIRYKKGEFIPETKLDEQSAKRLLFLNVVVKAIQEAEEIVESVPTKNTEESVEETLDINFEYDELKDEAKTLGLTWKGNISKENLIKLIIENNKQDYFLDQLEDEEEDLNAPNI